MNILVINAGSSSLKYQLIDMDNESVLAKGLCERISDGGHIRHTTADGRKVEYDIDLPTHTVAFNEVKKVLTTGEAAVIESMSEISAVGHRIVQGGAIFKKSELVDEKTIAGIESLIPLAPLHNRAHLQGILACRETLGTEVPEVVVFDTSFHATMPPEAYMFAIPYEYYEKNQIRRYGFHGTSHRYVSGRCIEMMGKDASELKIITCHLGNGSSIAAVKGGKVVDTTMGLTPLDGFIMGTRTGTLDPSVVSAIMDIEEEKGNRLSGHDLSEMFNKKSGILGISGVSGDNRDVEAAANQGNERAILALKMQRYQIRKFVGAFAAAMDGVDAIVFTGGIGENSAELRKDVCDNITYLGVKINDEENAKLIRGKGGEISTQESAVRVFVIPTNEELVIARDTLAIVSEK